MDREELAFYKEVLGVVEEITALPWEFVSIMYGDIHGLVLIVNKLEKRNRLLKGIIERMAKDETRVSKRGNDEKTK